VIRWSRYNITSHSNVQKDLSYLQSDFISGCALLIKQEALLQVGLLDSSYFLYFEDVDYSVRVRGAGYEIVTVRESKVYHKVSRTTNRLFKANSVYYTHRNRIWFTLKYCPKKFLCIALINILIRSTCAFCYYETIRAHPCALAVINGLKEGFGA
jgi:GT2 family glycosyltransferase